MCYPFRATASDRQPAGEEGGKRRRVSAPHVWFLLQGMSETFETLHNLVHKGVKVVMDIPYELWNETSAEVADLKKQVQALGPSEAAVPQGWEGMGLSLRNPPRAGGLRSSHFLSLAAVSSGESWPPACLVVGCEAWLGSSGSESVPGLRQCEVL